MQLLGTEVDDGFTLQDLEQIRNVFTERGAVCELIDLNQFHQTNKRFESAYILIIRKGIRYITQKEEGATDLLAENLGLEPDTKAKMRGRVVNKKARHNLCFGEIGQVADIEAGKGTIVPYSEVPVLASIRSALPTFFGEKARNLWCEGNYYYDARKCGIGFHGDGERKRVIALRLGVDNPLHYQWYLRFEPVGERCALTLHHGDVYVMGEKAVGTDWKKSSILTLRHAAGEAYVS